MPTPKKGQSQQEFMKICIPQVLADKTAKDNPQAVAICMSIWKKRDAPEGETRADDDFFYDEQNRAAYILRADGKQFRLCNVSEQHARGFHQRYLRQVAEMQARGERGDPLNYGRMFCLGTIEPRTRSNEEAIAVSGAAPKQDDRRRKLSFSSEQAVVPRWFGKEILDHTPSAVRTDFLNSGHAPILLNHDRFSQPVGVIEKGSVQIGKDKVGRALGRWGKTATAQDALTNADDGIMTNTSVGYQVHEMRLENEKDGEDPTYKVTDWEPHEVSQVGLPADRSVGVGRADPGNSTQAARPQEKRQMDAEQTATGGAAAGTESGNGAGGAAAGAGAGGGSEQTRGTTVQAGAQGKSAAQMEEDRISSIRNLCKAYNIEKNIADIWISGGTELRTVSEEILRIQEKRSKEAPTKSVADLGLTKREVKRYSLLKAIRAICDKNWSRAQFELECSQEIAKRLNKTPDDMRFFMPYDIQNREIPASAIAAHADPRYNMFGAQANPLVRSGLPSISGLGNPNGYLTRDTVVGTTTAGGYLVETINLSFIELLRNRTVAFRLGATVLSGLVGNVSIPKQTGAATAYWFATEEATLTESDPVFGQLAFSPHTVGGYTQISRLLLLQSSPDIEGIVNADLAAIVGIAVDAAVINGTGSSGQPHGIVGLTGVGTGTGATLGLAGLLTAQGTVGAANVVPVRGGWAAPFSVSELLRARNEFSNTYSPLWYGSIWDGMMVGYPALASNQIPSGDMIFGDWAQVVVGEWGVLEVEVNPYANFQAGVIGIRAIMTVDVQVRYPGAFYVTTSIT